MKQMRPSCSRIPMVAAVAMATWAGALDTHAALKDNIVAYWPLDEVVGTKTPDLVSGYDMELANLTAADLVDGKRGKAFKFENSRQTMLKRINAPGEQLPINQFEAFTVTFWANIAGTGLTDLRLFSEGSTTSNDPLFNLGTDNTGATGKLDVFLRRSGWTTVNHIKSEGEPLDGTWHHITFVQSADGSRALYFDGVRDPLEIPAKESGAWPVNTTTLGGILRANPTHWMTGLLDDVAMWSRALSETEIKQVVSEGLVSVFPPLAKGMVAYWPLDEVFGVKTPDLVNGYDMELVNLTSADLVAGKRGKAFQFENTRQTMLKRVNSAGEQLPINQFPALTVSFWANVTGTGLTDLRLFSEGNTANNNPLFNLGTASTGASGQLDLFIRKDPWATVDHLKTVGEPLDGSWRHIVFVQQQDGSRAVYVDGVKDDLEIPAKPAGEWALNTTTLGGILRANPTHWLTGQLDEVALWSRGLSPEEIKSVFTDGTPIPFSKPQPLAIRSFKADLPAVAVGDSVWLRWDVSKNVQVAIDPGVGDVTALTVSGLGAVQVPLAVSKTFTLTLTRGTEKVSSQVSVAAIDGVAAGWTLIDNFDRYPAGMLNGQSAWKDLDAVDFVLADVGGNIMVGANAGDATASLPLGPLTVKEGQQNTLFFRIYQVGDPAEAAKGMVALSDRNVRFGSDVGAAGNDIGPGAVASTELGAGLQLGGSNGTGAPVDFYEPILQPLTVYNVWVDIRNGPFAEDQSSTGDTYSIFVAKEGTAARTPILTDYVSARGQGAADVGFATKDLNKLILGGLNGTSTTTNLFFDDVYLSKSGYLATVPRKFGFTTPVPGAAPEVSISRSGAQVQITFGGGTLQAADTASGPWGDVPGAASPLTVPASGTGRFYRVRQ